MSLPPGPRPVFERPDVASVLVHIVPVDGPERQRAVADAVVAHWRSRRWPEGLVSLNCYTSTDGRSVLTYAQWSSEEALRDSLRDEESVSRGKPGWGVPGVVAPEPAEFRLYRAVRPTALPDPEVVAECFPGAVFTMADGVSARKWIDTLLASEEEAEGEDRAYPGAIAANFHVGADDSSVLVLSEWVSEEEAVAHIGDVIEPLLAQAGGGDAGARYSHYSSLAGLAGPAA
ncbi:antibiotic biosynthesis monooxygenase [Streptomyces griseocarneus]|uniref:antibiotic biosynthesis monooxygenase n=1 Tax=Streptomyces griseocarneus TaxID=51201 RepID=UPI00167C9A8E|nr:antibiotic biosynthesis monooxygenase [Streptomyces griseocarneus]MBZ6477618.1 hypothetical protein [Streptomyces griseocarneus]GHG83275.1 hypothetical protein GCM10018779_66320 [Streptomyces griseocarneus]